MEKNNKIGKESQRKVGSQVSRGEEAVGGFVQKVIFTKKKKSSDRGVSGIEWRRKLKIKSQTNGILCVWERNWKRIRKLSWSLRVKESGFFI